MPADSLRPLTPRGVYLTEDGFRKVLLERTQLLECGELLGLSKQAVSILKVDNSVLEKQNTILSAAVKEQAGALKAAKVKFRGAHVERWIWRGAAVAIAIYIIRR